VESATFEAVAVNESVQPQASEEALSQKPWWQRGFPGIVWSAYRSWFAHRTIRFGAGLAYYGLFAAVPLVAVSLFVAGLIFSQQDVGQYLASQLEPIVGANAAAEVADFLDGLQEDISNSLDGIVLFIVTVVAASFVFVALQDGINIVWEAPRRRGLEAGLKRRLLAVGLVLLGAAALAVGLIVSVILGAISEALSSRGLIDAVADFVSSMLSALILVVLVLAIFKFLPNVAVGWPSAVISSIVTTAALLVGTRLTAMYLENFSGVSLAGAASALLGLLAWLYLEAQILLAGAELNRAIELRDAPAAADTGDRRPQGAADTHPQNTD
jgi:membrane protein